MILYKFRIILLKLQRFFNPKKNNAESVIKDYLENSR